ncbi:hypothetical protein CDL12_06597 [Handroanthus impetiginosus]|uniref:NAC domain-containing protein n=1 Tax=Handroanthus impetiginosus TaxID=429701 RepID=A0A2G9HT73_9LAMI|nr:hypothetical protein CDL12_06597 [Handroanthus impetiginosus]
MPEIDNNISPNYTTSCKKESIISLQHGSFIPPHHNHFLELPLLESCPKLMLNDINPTFGGMNLQTSDVNSEKQLVHQTLDQNNFQSMSEDDQVTDWRILDKFVASQLSQEDSDTFPEKQDLKIASENASTSSSGCHENIDHLWKS